MKAFPKEDHAKEIKDLDLNGERPHTQRSLGLTWDIVTDTFNFQVSDNDKPNTRRGLLWCTVNSLYDPLGFAAPVITHGRLLLRELSVDSIEWDSPLPEDKRMKWETWHHSLKDLGQLHIPRAYTTPSLFKAKRKYLYKRQWMQVQHMANRFWNRWRAEYLQTLQPRRKWQEEQRNIQVNDCQVAGVLDLLHFSPTWKRDWIFYMEI